MYLFIILPFAYPVQKISTFGIITLRLELVLSDVLQCLKSYRFIYQDVVKIDQLCLLFFNDLFRNKLDSKIDFFEKKNYKDIQKSVVMIM